MWVLHFFIFALEVHVLHVILFFGLGIYLIFFHMFHYNIGCLAGCYFVCLIIPSCEDFSFGKKDVHGRHV